MYLYNVRIYKYTFLFWDFLDRKVSRAGKRVFIRDHRIIGTHEKNYSFYRRVSIFTINRTNIQTNPKHKNEH